MTERFTVSMDDELSARFDAYLRQHGYANRSEAVRDLVRGVLSEQARQQDADRPCVAAVTYLYDHQERDLGRRMTEAHHEQVDLTLSALHVHIDQRLCLETLVLRGPIAATEAFGNALISRPGIQHGHLHTIPLDQPSD